MWSKLFLMIALLKRHLGTTLSHSRWNVLALVLGLLILGFSQGTLVFLINGFLKAFFASPSESSFLLSELIPAKIYEFTTKLFGQHGGIEFTRQELAVWVPVSLLIAGFGIALGNYLYHLNQEVFTIRMAHHFRTRMFSVILKQDLKGLSFRSPGEWTTIVVNDAQVFQNRISDLLTGLVKDVVLILSAIGALFFIYWPGALVLLLFVPILALVMGRASRRISYFAAQFQRSLGEMAGWMLQLRKRFTFAKSQNAEAFEKYVFSLKNKSYLEMMTSSIHIRSVMTPLLEWLGVLMMCGFLYLWSSKSLGENFTPNIAFQFFGGLGATLRPLRQLGEQFTKWGETIGVLSRSLDLETKLLTQIDQKKQALVSPDSLKVSKDLSSMQSVQSLNIQCLEIVLDEQRGLTLKDLLFIRGKSVAIVGPSGSGKSTILKCFAGLNQPFFWQANVDWKNFVENCSFVSQTPFLFKSTIRENLLYGLVLPLSPREVEQRIWDVLKSLELDSFVASLPQGLETVFEPLKPEFSGGQIQRLSIARALIPAKPVLLLDEATAALDSVMERNIIENLTRYVRETNGVLIAVTHRLETLDLFDKIMSLDGSLIQERLKV